MFKYVLNDRSLHDNLPIIIDMFCWFVKKLQDIVNLK